MTSKAKALQTDGLKSSENPVSQPAAPLPSSILQSAIDRQEQELADLQTELDRRSDEFADRAAAIVRNSLETAYQKAQSRIMTVEVPRFFDSGANTLPLRSPKTPIALLPSIEGEVEC